jgi:hypothetical protein
LLVLPVGCEKKDGTPTASACVAYTVSHISRMNAQEDKAKISKINVFLDSSGSMKGFVKSGVPTVFTDSLKGLVNTIAVTFPNNIHISYQRFGTRLQPIDPKQLVNSITTPSFYTDQDTMFGPVLDAIAREEKEVLHLVVTDLFEERDSISALLEKIKSLVSNNKSELSLGVLGLRGEFDGTVSGIHINGVTYSFPFQGQRPFYLLMFGKREALREMYEAIANSILKQPNPINHNFVLFSGKPLELPLEFGKTEAVKKAFGLSAPDRILDRFAKPFMVRGKDKTASFDQSFVLHYRPYVARLSFSTSDISILSVNCDANERKVPAIGVGINASISNTTPDAVTLRFDIEPQALEKGQVRLVEVNITPKGVRDYPKWFYAWNLDQNQIPNCAKESCDGTRTINLYDFLVGIAKIYEGVPAKAYFLLLRDQKTL